jgi:hypothetical protein
MDHKFRAFASRISISFLAEKSPRAFHVAVAAPDRMSLASQQLCEQRTGAAGP